MPKSSIPMRIAKRLRSALNLPSPAILMYHRIGDECFDPWALAVSEANFAEQLGWLKRHRVPMRLTDMVELQRARKLPARAIALTFDDGYACNAGVAAPMLARHKIPATIFLTTGPIDEGREYWWDELERIVLAVDEDALDLDLPDGTRRLPLGKKQRGDREWAPGQPPKTRRQKAYQEAWSALKPLAPAEQHRILDRLAARHSLTAEPRGTHRPMVEAEIKTLQELGIEVGAHSLTHTSLPDRTVDEKRREIRGSRDRCASITGRAPKAFAYPYGDFDDESAQLVEALGFDCACTTIEGGMAHSDPYRLPRIQVRNGGADQLRAALAGR